MVELNGQNSFGNSENNITLTQSLPEALRHKKVLIVDDDQYQRDYVSRVLHLAGLLHVQTASDGVEALEMTFSSRPDLIILDVVMPRMNGFELCNVLRKHVSFADIPILIQTALDSEQERLKAFQCGASDLVNKPVHPDEIIARTRAHLEKQQLTISFRELQSTMRAELHTAMNMQSLLEPDSLLAREVGRDAGLEISGKVLHSQGLGGDIWGLRRLNENESAFYVCDFPGRGIATVMNLFRLQLILGHLAHAARTPGEMLQMINARIHHELDRSEYVKMFWGTYDRSSHSLSYAIAGGVRALHLRCDSAEVVPLISDSIPLGIREESDFSTQQVFLAPGDSVLVYSDMVDRMQDPQAAHVLIQTMFEMVLYDGLNHAPMRHQRLFDFIGTMTGVETNPNSPDDLALALITRTR